MTRYYAYIEVPPGDLRETILKFEREYQGGSRSLPHLTLLSPHKLITSATEAELIQIIGAATADHGPVQVRTKTVGHFNGFRNIHYCIEPTLELRSLVNKIKRSLRGIGQVATSYTAPRYHPHLTLAQGIDPKQGKELYEIARSLYVPGEFTARNIFLLRIREGEKHWKKIASVPL